MTELIITSVESIVVMLRRERIKKVIIKHGTDRDEMRSHSEKINDMVVSRECL